MEVIEKACNDNNLDLKGMEDFIYSVHEFLKKFDSSLEIGNLTKQLELSKTAIGFFSGSKKEYLQSVIDFIDCLDLDSETTVLELQVHLENCIENLIREGQDE